MIAALLSTVAFALAEAPASPPSASVATAKLAQAAEKPVAKPAARPASKKPVAKPAAKPVVTAAVAATPSAASKPLVFSGESDAAVADRALRYIESLTSLRGDFTQIAPSGAAVSGKFYLRRPGQVRFDYADPSPITIVATQGMVYVENADLETTDSYPLKKTPLRFLLSKKIDLGDAKLVAVERTADSVAVTYASTAAETEGEITLHLAAPDLSIREWAVKDARDGYTVVALQNVRLGEKLDNRLFKAPEAGGAFINND